MLERVARDKHSSLLQKSVNYGRKKFFEFAPGQNFPPLFRLLKIKVFTFLFIRLLSYKSVVVHIYRTFTRRKFLWWVLVKDLFRVYGRSVSYTHLTLPTNREV